MLIDVSFVSKRGVETTRTASRFESLEGAADFFYDCVKLGATTRFWCRSSDGTDYETVVAMSEVIAIRPEGA